MIFAMGERLKIMNKIRFTFSSFPDRIIDEQKLISEITAQFGCTRKKAAEYIRELLDGGFIEHENNFLKYKIPKEINL